MREAYATFGLLTGAFELIMNYHEKYRFYHSTLHCSATKAGQDFTATDIDRWHRERGFNWPVRIVKAGINEVSGYVISADWMRTGVRQIPGRMLKNGCFIR